MSELETVQDVDGSIWYRGAANAIDQTLQVMGSVLLAMPKQSPHRSLLRQIAVLAGLNIDNKVSNNITLRDLGLSEEKVSIVCSYIRDVAHMSFDEKDASHLTIERINQIEQSSVNTPLPEVKGLKSFISCADPDELLATTEIVLMPTLIHQSSMRDDEFDASETFLWIVPGLEGHYARFRALCEHLKLPALVLQPGLDHPWETPKQLASRFFKILQKKTGIKKSFYILAYETGVITALELVAILEEYRVTGTVFCLGEGPLEMQALLESGLCSFPSEPALQDGLAKHMLALMTRDLDVSVEGALRGCTTWSERVDACVRSLRGRVPHSVQYARALLEAVYSRINVARHAVFEPRALRSRFILLRSRRECEPDITSSLQSFSQQKLEIRELTTPIAHAASDHRVPAIINSFLDDDILQSF